MKKNKRLVLEGIILLLAVIFLFSLFTNTGKEARVKLLNTKPAETYIGGVCTCPPDGSTLRVVNLYRSKGESIEEIKAEEQKTDCSQFGCSLPTEYHLYP